MSDIINQNTEPLFIFDMPDDETLSETISVKGEKGAKGDPTKLSQLDNDTGFITKDASNLTNYYDKTAIDTKFGGKLDKATFNAYEIPSDFFTGDETVSGTGNTISLSDTTNAAFKSVAIYGDTSQNGTPTVETPIDIGVVTGEQTVAIAGDGTQTCIIDLGSLELCVIDAYKDYIHRVGDKWYKHKAIGKQTMSVSSLRETYTNINYAQVPKLSDAISYQNYKQVKVFCTHAKYPASQGNWDTADNIDKIYTGAVAGLYWIGIPKNTTLAEAKAAIDGGTLYYVLATAVEEEITDAALITQLNTLAAAKTYLGLTTISVSGDLAASLSVEAFKGGWDGTVKGISNDLGNKADKIDLAQRPYYFDSIASMKGAKLADGDYATTSGYYVYGDGGGADYRIVDDSNLTDDGATVHTLSNGLKAVLIIKDNTIYVKQFGARGNGSTNDSTAIQKALAWNGNNASRVVFEHGATFIAKDKLYIYSNTDVDLNGATIKDANGVTVSTGVNNLQFLNNLTSLTTAGYGALVNFKMHDGTLDGNIGGVMFCMLHAQDCYFENIDFNNAFVSTHVFDLGGCKDITIKNCNFIGCLMSVSDNAYREVIQPDYATYGSTPYWGDDESYAFDALPTDGLTVDGCVFKKNDGDTYYLNAVGTHSINQTALNNITVRNCKFYGCHYSNIRLPRATNVLIENNVFYSVNGTRTGDNYAINCVQMTSGSYNIVTSESITIKNNKYFATLDTDDQIFIGVKGYNSSNLAKNISIVDNEFNGVFTDMSSTASQGQDFMQLSNVDNVLVENNKVNRAKAVIFKTINGICTNLKVLSNICKNCSRFIRGGDNSSNNYATSLAPTGFVVRDNVWTNSLGTIDTSSFKVTLGFTEDVTINPDSHAAFVPLEILDNDMLKLSGNFVLLPQFIKKARVSGNLSIVTASGVSVQWIQLQQNDRLNLATITNSYDHLITSSEHQRSFNAGELVIDDKDLLCPYYNDEQDGRFKIGILVNATGEITLKANNTKIYIESL